MVLMTNGSSFQLKFPPDVRACFFWCARPCLLLAQLFKIQVNLSWWLAVWSQEVASVRGVTQSFTEFSVTEKKNKVKELDVSGKRKDCVNMVYNTT